MVQGLGFCLGFRNEEVTVLYVYTRGSTNQVPLHPLEGVQRRTLVCRAARTISPNHSHFDNVAQECPRPIWSVLGPRSFCCISFPPAEKELSNIIGYASGAKELQLVDIACFDAARRALPPVVLSLAQGNLTS